MNIISIALRVVGLLVSAGTFVFQVGEILGVLIFGALIGILIWSVLDLIFGLFQDKPTQGVNSGVSVVNSVIVLPYFQIVDVTSILIAGLAFGFVIAAVLDWQTSTS